MPSLYFHSTSQASNSARCGLDYMVSHGCIPQELLQNSVLFQCRKFCFCLDSPFAAAVTARFSLVHVPSNVTKFSPCFQRSVDLKVVFMGLSRLD